MTFFTGRIAFRDSAESFADYSAAIQSGDIVNVPELANYNYAALNVKRLVEVVQNNDFTLELRTDIVNFPLTNTQGADTALLIYSIDYQAPGQASKPKLITAFPVASSFAAGVFNPTGLGEQLPIALKYNAVLPVSIPASQMIGKRFIANESEITLVH